MNLFKINVQEPYYDYIINGQKTIEGRLNKGKFSLMQIGDHLLINNEFKCKIKRKTNYKSFQSMIESEGVKSVVPDKKGIQEATNVYYNFFTKEQEQKFGVVAIKISKI
ncbi:MAG: ASCH domain-containing protein [Candidatus Moraniibacteriota bacterium]